MGGRTSLGWVFQDALLAAGVGASGLALGCSALTDPGLVGPSESRPALRTTPGPSGAVTSDPGFELVQCNAEPYPEPLYLQDLSPSPAVDYVELRYPGGGLLEAVGSACLGADAESACRSELERVPEAPSLVLGHVVQVLTQVQLSATLGGEVLRVAGADELPAFLGNIDTPGEARLLVASRDFSLICGESGSVARADGVAVLAFTQEGCDGRTRYLLHVGPDGVIDELDRFVERAPDPYCIVGRRPVGGRTGSPVALRSSLARFFSNCAELEADSVAAFVGLARELEAHGAPVALARRARSAAQDEVRHARAVGQLARRWGGKPRFRRVPPSPPRSLKAMALDNAVEGCVRETYGALVAHYQHARTSLPAVAQTYRPIAADETRHSELSWDVASWAEPRLGSAAKRRVSSARRAAADMLIDELRASRPQAIDAAAGLPDPTAGAGMAERLGRTLWRA